MGIFSFFKGKTDVPFIASGDLRSLVKNVPCTNNGVFAAAYDAIPIASEKEHFCTKCGKITLHTHHTDDELKCTECGNVIEED